MDPHRRILPDLPNFIDSPNICPTNCSLGCAPPCSPILASSPPPPPSANLHHSHLTNNLLLAFSLIGGVFFLVLVFYAVRRRRRRLLRRTDPSSPPGEDGVHVSDGEDDGVVHHAWYIRTVGLDEATIASIAVTEYRAGAGLLGAADCSVCLGGFQDGDLVRLLPKCGHAFHVPCIDTWLRAHVTCPLCRADIVDPSVEPALSGPSGASISGTVLELGSPSSLETIETGIASPASNTGDLEPPPTPPSAAAEEEAGGGTVFAQVGVLALPAESPDMAAPSNLGEGGVQPVRRSASMNSPFICPAEVAAALEEIVTEKGKSPMSQEDQRGKDKQKHDNPSKFSTQSGLKQIRRSMSSSSMACFFASRSGRSRSPVLPL